MDYITYNGIHYPIRELWLNEREMVVMVSSEELNEVLFDSAGSYFSESARLVDEQIFFFLPEILINDGRDEEIERFIIENM